jgi:hypothetical protein
MHLIIYMLTNSAMQACPAAGMQQQYYSMPAKPRIHQRQHGSQTSEHHHKIVECVTMPSHVQQGRQPTARPVLGHKQRIYTLVKAGNIISCGTSLQGLHSINKNPPHSSCAQDQ